MLLKLAWRNIWRNKRRSLITIVSILAAVLLAIIMRSIQLGMYDNLIQNMVGSYTGYVQVHADGYWKEQSVNNSLEENEELYKTLRSVHGVVDIVPRLSTYVLASAGELTKGISITGLDTEKEKQMRPLADRLTAGSVFTEHNEILIGKSVAEYFHSAIDDTIVFIGQGYHGSNAAGKYIVSGIVDMKNPMLNQSTIFMGLKPFQEFLDAPHLVSKLIIVKEDGIDEKVLAHNIAANIDLDKYEVMDWHEMQPEIDQTILVDSIGGLIMVAILYMIITFGIFGTVLMMVQERMYEMGILISIGMKKVNLATIIFLETIFLSIIGIVAGMIVASPIIFYFNRNPIDLSDGDAASIEQFGFEAIIPAIIDPSIFQTHGLIILLTTAIISIYPFIIILKLDPIQAMKS